MKLAPSERVGERNRIGGDFGDGVGARNIAGVAVTADVDEGVGVAHGIEAIEDRREHAVIPEPTVDDDDLCRAIADRFMPNHDCPWVADVCSIFRLSMISAQTRSALVAGKAGTHFSGS